MRLSRNISLSSLLIYSSLFRGLSAQVNVEDFSFYPQGSRGCLLSASGSSNCDKSTVPKYNACVCSNGGGFIDSAAKCIGANSAGDLTTVYNIMSRNCGDSSTPIAYSLDKFLAAANANSGTTAANNPATKISTVVQTIIAPTAGATSEVIATVTLAPTAGQTEAVTSIITLKPGQSTQLATILTIVGGTATAAGSKATETGAAGAGSGKKLSTEAVVGIAVGVPCFLAVMGIFLFLFLRYRKQQTPPPANTVAATTQEYHPPNDAAAAEKRPGSFYTASTVTPDPTKYPQPTPSPVVNPAYPQPQPQQYAPQQQYPQQNPYPQPGQYQQYSAQPPNPQPYGYQQPNPQYVELGGNAPPTRIELPDHR